MLTDNMKKLRLLLVIAHPDDESLWFFGGLTKLSRDHEIIIYCLTYTADSERGRELFNATSDLNVKCFFGGLIDVGFDKCLYNVRQIFTMFINESAFDFPFDLVITHPFHGGEKPHPHHLQAFHIVRQECRKRKIAFGFFSEKRLPLYPVKSNIFKMSLKNQMRFNFWYLSSLLKTFPSQWNLVREILFFTRELLEDFFIFKNTFVLHRFFVRPSEKLCVLEKYSSQFHHLLKYKAIYESVEYLYVDESIELT